MLPNGEQGIATTHNFYDKNNPYALVLGIATIYYHNGIAVGFKDRYNFNWKCLLGKNRRKLSYELKVRAVSIFGFLYGAKPFDITYGLCP